MNLIYENKEIIKEEDYLYFFKSITDAEGNVKEEALIYAKAIANLSDDGIYFTLSDDSLDRDYERIDQTGWDLKNYKKNPVILWQHDTKIPAIGKMENVSVKDNKLTGKAVFVPKEIDEFGWSVGEKVRQNFITSGSVGFRSLRIEFPRNSKDGTKLIHRAQELTEYSIVNVPALPNSTRKEYKISELFTQDNEDNYSKLFKQEQPETINNIWSTI